MVRKSADAATPDQPRLVELYVMVSLGYDPAGTTEQVVPPAAEYVPTGHEVVPVAPAKDSCVTGPVVVQVVEALMGRASYTEW